MKKRNLYFISILVSILFNVTHLTAQSQGNRINVPGDFAKIQDAINSSVHGDTIIVAPGTYLENVNFRGKNVLLSSHYLFDEDVSFINTTIIDGSNPQYPDTASVVIFLSEEENTAILQGFTITGGKGTKIYDTENQFFVRVGGGIEIYKSSPTIRHNIIAYNESRNAVGVSKKGGGGISVNNSSAIISNNIIFKNISYDGGGAGFGPNPGAIFRNNIIAYNTTLSNRGGGLFIFGPQSNRFKNNTIAFNHSNLKGGIVIERDGNLELENCIIYGNTTGSTNSTNTQISSSGIFNISNSDIEGGWTGYGNIDVNPLFVGNSPLILQDGSPCIDMGDMTTANNDFEDPDNLGFPLPPALGTLRNDMGAYGGNQYKSMPYMITLITGIGDEYGTLQNKSGLNQNYPNPFSQKTTISYYISKLATTSLKVYDISGREVKTLVNKHQLTGSYKIEFDASSLPGGVYFYKVNSGKFSDIKKLILIK